MSSSRATRSATRELINYSKFGVVLPNGFSQKKLLCPVCKQACSFRSLAEHIASTHLPFQCAQIAYCQEKTCMKKRDIYTTQYLTDHYHNSNYHNFAMAKQMCSHRVNAQCLQDKLIEFSIFLGYVTVQNGRSISMSNDRAHRQMVDTFLNAQFNIKDIIRDFKQPAHKACFVTDILDAGPADDAMYDQQDYSIRTPQYGRSPGPEDRSPGPGGRSPGPGGRSPGPGGRSPGPGGRSPGPGGRSPGPGGRSPGSRGRSLGRGNISEEEFCVARSPGYMAPARNRQRSFVPENAPDYREEASAANSSRSSRSTKRIAEVQGVEIKQEVDADYPSSSSLDRRSSPPNKRRPFSSTALSSSTVPSTNRMEQLPPVHPQPIRRDQQSSHLLAPPPPSHHFISPNAVLQPYSQQYNPGFQCHQGNLNSQSNRFPPPFSSSQQQPTVLGFPLSNGMGHPTNNQYGVQGAVANPLSQGRSQSGIPYWQGMASSSFATNNSAEPRHFQQLDVNAIFGLDEEDCMNGQAADRKKGGESERRRVDRTQDESEQRRGGYRPSEESDRRRDDRSRRDDRPDRGRRDNNDRSDRNGYSRDKRN